MSIKKTVITWAEGKERGTKSWQETNFSKIGREYDKGNIDENKAMSKISDELAKTGDHLSDSEKRDLKSKLF